MIRIAAHSSQRNDLPMYHSCVRTYVYNNYYLTFCLDLKSVGLPLLAPTVVSHNCEGIVPIIEESRASIVLIR